MLAVEAQIRALNRKLGFDDWSGSHVDGLRLSQAARQLGITTRDVVRLVHERRVRHVMVEGIAQIPADAVQEHRATQAPER